MQGQRHRPPPPPATFSRSKEKKGGQWEKRKDFKAETIKRLPTRSKYYCFNHSRASRIRKFFLSVNHGGRKYFSVFHANPPHPATTSPIQFSRSIPDIIYVLCFDFLIFLSHSVLYNRQIFKCQITFLKVFFMSDK